MENTVNSSLPKPVKGRGFFLNPEMINEWAGCHDSKEFTTMELKQQGFYKMFRDFNA